MIDHARNVQYTVVYSAHLIEHNEIVSTEDARNSSNVDVDDKRIHEPKVGLKKNVKNVSKDSMNLTENTIFSKKLVDKLSKVDRVALPWKLVSRCEI